RADPDVGDGLATRPRAVPDAPAGMGLLDIDGEAAFQVAVVPFLEVRVADRDGTVPGKGCRVGRAREGTGQDERERVPCEATAERASLIAPEVGQRDVGPAGVSAEARPFCLAV